MTLLAPVLALLAAAEPTTPHVAGGGPAAERAEPRVAGPALLARAAGEILRLRRALTEVLSRVEDARVERDLVKLLCADDKLTRMKVLVGVAERAETELAEAIATRDESALTEYSKIAIARGKVDALRAEAAACIGQLAYETAERTMVLVETPEELPRVGARGVARDLRGAGPYRTDFGIPSAAR